MKFVIDAPEPATTPVSGGGVFPVRRIFCIGRNYADHVKEMGGDARKDPPVFFTKPADAAVSRAVIPFPPMTNDLHFEGELVVALAGGGANIPSDDCASVIYGYAVGCDLTRRDLQAAAKKAGAPWDMAKGFDHSAPIGDIRPGGVDFRARLELSVNGAVRQSASLDEMIWSVPDLISELSKYVELAPGDLIFTGTPAGVGALSRGDKVRVEIGDLPALEFSMGE